MFSGMSRVAARVSQVQRRHFSNDLLSRGSMNRHTFRRSRSSMIGSAQRPPMAASVWAEEASARASAGAQSMRYNMYNGELPGEILVLPTMMMLGAMCAPNASYEMVSRMAAGHNVNDERARRGSFPYAY